MKKLLIPVFLCLFAAAAYGQRTYVLKVNGIGLGSTDKQVLNVFGKLLSDTTEDGDECIGGKLRKLKYPGLLFEFHQQGDDPKKFYVGSFEVFSSKWDVSGVRVGALSLTINRQFSKPESLETDAATKERTWYYALMDIEGPGNTSFHLRGGKIVRISTFYIC